MTLPQPEPDQRGPVPHLALAATAMAACSLIGFLFGLRSIVWQLTTPDELPWIMLLAYRFHKSVDPVVQECITYCVWGAACALVYLLIRRGGLGLWLAGLSMAACGVTIDRIDHWWWTLPREGPDDAPVPAYVQVAFLLGLPALAGCIMRWVPSDPEESAPTRPDNAPLTRDEPPAESSSGLGSTGRKLRHSPVPSVSVARDPPVEMFCSRAMTSEFPQSKQAPGATHVVLGEGALTIVVCGLLGFAWGCAFVDWSVVGISNLPSVIQEVRRAIHSMGPAILGGSTLCLWGIACALLYRLARRSVLGGWLAVLAVGVCCLNADGIRLSATYVPHEGPDDPPLVCFPFVVALLALPPFIGWSRRCLPSSTDRRD